jgi:hypothetical protein
LWTALLILAFLAGIFGLLEGRSWLELPRAGCLQAIMLIGFIVI